MEYEELGGVVDEEEREEKAEEEELGEVVGE